VSLTFITDTHSIDSDGMKRKPGRNTDVRHSDLIQAKDRVAGRTDKMYVLIVVVMGRAFGGANGIGGCTIQIKYFMEYAFFFKTGEDTVQGYAVNIVAQYFFQIGLRYSGFFVVNDIQHTKPGFRHPELISA